MVKVLRMWIKSLSSYIELFLSLLMAVAIGIMIVRLCIYGVPEVAGGVMELETFMAHVLTFAVGVEFIKMLCQHTPETMIEVLMFAISREMIVERLTPLQTLIGVSAIAGLFAIRKFLFFKFDDDDRIIFRASQTVGSTNRWAGVSIPGDSTMLLRDFVLKELESQGRNAGIGTMLEYGDCALRIDSITNGVITRVEVIRSV